MALINKIGRYIKMTAGDDFEVYINEEARLKFKKSTSSEVIIKKYEEIIHDLFSEKYAEMKYYNGKEYGELLKSWTDEYSRYMSNCSGCTSIEEYPLMAVYYPDVADSIPKIVFRGKLGGRFGEHSKTAEEAYLMAKQDQIWGETTDA